MARELLIKDGRLVSDLDADGFRIKNLPGGGGGIVDDTVTRTSSNAVKSSGIWSAIWGTLAALPSGFSSLYDWVVSQLAGKVSKTGDTMTGSLKLKGAWLGFEDAETPADMGGIYVAGDTSTGGTVLRLVQWQDGGMQTVVGLTAGNAATKGDIPAASTSTPLADGTASPGSSAAYARGDHVHPAETLVVTATLNLANMTVTSLSHTFAQILAARQAGRNVLLEANAMVNSTEGGRLLAWCSAEFGDASGQSLQVGQIWFSAFMYSDLFDGSSHTYYGAVSLYYTGAATLDLKQLVEQSDLAELAQTTLSIAGDTRTVTATDSGGTEAYKFAGTGETTDANTVVRVGALPYVNVGEAEEMLAGVYGILSRGVQRHTATSGETSATFGFADTPGTGRIADALLDIDNSGNSSDFALEFYGLGTDFALAVPDGDDLAEMTSVDGGKHARFYFTETALVSNNLPVISVQRMTIEVVTTQGGA